MDSTLWDKIWVHFFVPMADEYLKKFRYIDKFDSDKKTNIYQTYQKYNKKYKDINFPNKDDRIDRHKVAAIFACSILKQLPFKLNFRLNPIPIRDGNYYPYTYFINELFGIKIAINHMRWNLIQEGEITIDNKWKFPECRTKIGESDEEDYLLHLTRDLYAYRKRVYCNNNKDFFFLIPSLSHIFFFLENYFLNNK